MIFPYSDAARDSKNVSIMNCCIEPKNKKFKKQSFELWDELLFGTKWSEFTLLEKISIILVSVTPIFYLGVKHWITNLSIMACIFSMWAIASNRSKFKLNNISHFYLIILIFSIYVFAITISQIGRQSFVLRDYLDQSRWLVGLPFYLSIYYFRINYVKVLDWAIPVSIFSAWIGSTYIIPSGAWGDRQTISFIDPLTFGYMNLALAMVCFSSVAFDVQKKYFSLNTLIKILAFGLGLYLSIQSGSRTGWLAFPIVIVVVFFILYELNYKINIFFAGILICILVIFYQYNNIIQYRIDALVMDLKEYPWGGGVAHDSSVGLRITFYRLGYYYFTQSPFFGWGERGYGEIKNAFPLISFSTQFARDFAYEALFHSEWTTQAVRFGIIGLMGVFFVFFIPISLFINFNKLSKGHKKISCMGLAYMICILVASFSHEVFNSKGTITFSAIVIAGLLATAHSSQRLLFLKS